MGISSLPFLINLTPQKPSVSGRSSAFRQAPSTGSLREGKVFFSSGKPMDATRKNYDIFDIIDNSDIFQNITNGENIKNVTGISRQNRANDKRVN